MCLPVLLPMNHKDLLLLKASRECGSPEPPTTTSFKKRKKRDASSTTSLFVGHASTAIAASSKLTSKKARNKGKTLMSSEKSPLASLIHLPSDDDDKDVVVPAQSISPPSSLVVPHTIYTLAPVWG
ncbi:hypothetical protein V6N12_046012 [Hibiscus sabdariffa]|uniref:Uncharacterized protein n=1 Tax=Hibiscus sabdariffa TaxID=183260 RepID=A0ABR2G4E0_9ROSI